MYTHFVIVPSISEITTKSVDSQTKIRAVHATAPEVDSEKVIVLAPGFKLRLFCDIVGEKKRVTIINAAFHTWGKS